jgi:hypothetical protein
MWPDEFNKAKEAERRKKTRIGFMRESLPGGLLFVTKWRRAGKPKPVHRLELRQHFGGAIHPFN